MFFPEAPLQCRVETPHLVILCLVDHLAVKMPQIVDTVREGALVVKGFLSSVQSLHIFHYQLLRVRDYRWDPHSGYNTIALDTFVALQNCFQEKEECKVKCSTLTALHNFFILCRIKYLVIKDFVCFVFLSRKW